MGRLALWVPAVLAAVALVAAAIGFYADRTVFGADGFAQRADAALERPEVSAEVARRLTTAAVNAEPDLIAIRPLIESVADGIVRGAAFRSLVRRAVRDVHRSTFDRHELTVTLAVADVGLLLAEALGHLRPDLAEQVPGDLQVRLASVASDAERAAVRAADLAHRVRIGAPIALALALILGVIVVLRGGALRLAVAVAATATPAALLALIAPRTVGDPAIQETLEVWLDPLAVWLGALATVAAIAAATLHRPGPITNEWLRWLAVLAAGIVLFLEPRVIGVALIVAAGSGLLRLALRAPKPRLRVPGAILAGAGLVFLIGGAVATAGDGPEPERVGRCNGSAELCDKPLDEVAFVGTHNSMAADREPGWLFAAQDAGMEAQLDDGVRALMIDTHYGFATPRGVATDLSRESKSREKVVGEVGEQFVETAQRLRERIGYTGGGTRELFLCHAFCEVGATAAVPALREIHRWLVAHPEEVLILSIEDDTDAETTEAAIRDSGLIREVYLGPAEPPWPTLREMIERDERVLVLVENEPSGAPWMHLQADVLQETPYHFGTPQELAAADTCRPNRGGTKGSLLLVNHWVDTSPAPRLSIAREVNSNPFLQRRLERCETERGMKANIIAVDFYRQGDVL